MKTGFRYFRIEHITTRDIGTCIFHLPVEYGEELIGSIDEIVECLEKLDFDFVEGHIYKLDYAQTLENGLLDLAGSAFIKLEAHSNISEGEYFWEVLSCKDLSDEFKLC